MEMAKLEFNRREALKVSPRFIYESHLRVPIATMNANHIKEADYSSVLALFLFSHYKLLTNQKILMGWPDVLTLAESFLKAK